MVGDKRLELLYVSKTTLHTITTNCDLYILILVYID